MPSKSDTDLQPEYDFSAANAVRGKHARAYKQGHSVTISQPNGSSVVQHFKLEDGAVLLAPDVAQAFPDSESVNQALRMLIQIAKDRLPKAS
jgi:hypothetical protein